MKKLILIVSFILSYSLTAQDARVQVVHNCADAMAAIVDVYVNGLLAVPDVPFRTSSPFTDLPSGIPVNIAVAPGDSNSVLDAFYDETFNLDPAGVYIVVANGIISPTGYNPSPPFSLDVFDMGREAASVPTNVDVLVHHGSTDAPTIDAVEVGQELGNIVDDLSYSEYQGYLELPAQDYIIEVRDETSTNVIATYEAPLGTFGLEGFAVTVMASGFFDPSQNSNGPEFGFFAVPPTGGPLFPLPELLGIDEGTENDIIVYPNPVTDLLYVESATSAEFSYLITDVLGNIASRGNVISGKYIDISSFSSGIYLLQLETSEGIRLQRKLLKR